MAMAGHINESSAVKAKARIGFAAKPGCIWESIRGIDQWGSWNPKISGARLLSPFKSKADFQWKAGGMPIRSRIQKVDSGHVLTWTGSMLSIKAIRRWEVDEGVDDTAHVEVEESLDGLIVRPFIGDQRLGIELDGWLKRLKDHCEEKPRE